jgi:hypothetical protein
MSLVSLNWKTVLALGAAGLVVYEYAKGEVVTAAKTAGKAVNPVDDANVFNRGAEAVYSEATGDDRSPGAALAEWVHGPSGGECFTKVKLPNGEYRAAWHPCGQGPDMSQFPAGTKEVG